MFWYDDVKTSYILIGNQISTVQQYVCEAKNNYENYYSIPNIKNRVLDILDRWTNENSNDNYKFNISEEVETINESVSDNVIGSLAQINYLISLIDFTKIKLGIILSSLLTDLFVNQFLPPTRSLISLDDRPYDRLPRKRKKNCQIPARAKILSLWYFEHRFKTIYSLFLNILKNQLVIKSEKELKDKILNLFIQLSKFEENNNTITNLLLENGIKISLLRPRTVYKAFSIQKTKVEDNICIVISDSDDDEISISETVNDNLRHNSIQKLSKNTQEHIDLENYENMDVENYEKDIDSENYEKDIESENYEKDIDVENYEKGIDVENNYKNMDFEFCEEDEEENYNDNQEISCDPEIINILEMAELEFTYNQVEILDTEEIDNFIYDNSINDEKKVNLQFDEVFDLSMSDEYHNMNEELSNAVEEVKNIINKKIEANIIDNNYNNLEKDLNINLFDNLDDLDFEDTNNISSIM